MAEFRKCFHAIDVNDVGHITLADLRSYMQKMNYTEKFIKSWIKLFNLTEDGILTYEHFCKTLGLVPRKHETQEPVKPSNCEPGIESESIIKCEEVRDISHAPKEATTDPDASTSEYVIVPAQKQESKKAKKEKKHKAKKKETEDNISVSPVESKLLHGSQPTETADWPNDTSELEESVLVDPVHAHSDKEMPSSIEFPLATHSPVSPRPITPVIPDPIENDLPLSTMHAPVQSTNQNASMHNTLESVEPMGFQIGVNQQPTNPDFGLDDVLHININQSQLDYTESEFSESNVVKVIPSENVPSAKQEKINKKQNGLCDEVAVNSKHFTNHPEDEKALYPRNSDILADECNNTPTLKTPQEVFENIVPRIDAGTKLAKNKTPKTKASKNINSEHTGDLNSVVKVKTTTHHPDFMLTPSEKSEVVVATTIAPPTVLHHAKDDNKGGPEMSQSNNHGLERPKAEIPGQKRSDNAKTSKKQQAKKSRMEINSPIDKSEQHGGNALNENIVAKEREHVPNVQNHVSSTSEVQNAAQSKSNQSKKKLREKQNTDIIKEPHQQKHLTASLQEVSQTKSNLPESTNVFATDISHEKSRFPYLNKREVQRRLKEVTTKVKQNKALSKARLGRRLKHKTKNEKQGDKEKKEKKSRFPRSFTVQPDSRRAKVEQNKREFIKQKLLERRCPDKVDRRLTCRSKRVTALDRRWKVRPSLKTRGSVLILLGGSHRGKRVIYLGRQRSTGLLLVTGPFKYNGCPLRRVHPNMVIVTKTRINLKQFTLPERIHQLDYFARSKDRNSKKDASLLMEQTPSKPDRYKPNEQRKEDQLLIDQQVCERIKTHPDSRYLIKYLKSLFCLSKNEKPHRMVF